MVLNFDDLDAGQSVDTILPPREIFNALNKASDRFQYPRDVQSQVWKKWFDRRNSRNLVLKMNTGGGKTLVGLLILKSCLNEGKGPAVFVVPDNYLVKQVMLEAKELGVEAVEDPNDFTYVSSKAILITNIYKVINGKSVFGVGDEGSKLTIKSIIIDDAHACLNVIDEQFSITIDRTSSAFDKIYQIFKNTIKLQCNSKALEIETEYPSAYIQVPYWDWQDKLDYVREILIQHKDDDNIKFKWPLLKEDLKYCSCVISGSTIEISTTCIPIESIPSFTDAERRIFMTATLSDDSVLATHFGVKEDLNDPITPETAGDVGDRLILMPQGLNTNICDNDIKQLCKNVSKLHNVVVIVPSKKRANFWKDIAAQVLDKNSIYTGVDDLKTKHLGLTVLVNRYDGIDLPDDACRLLIIDGFPDSRSKIERIKQNQLKGTPKQSHKVAHILEQGMGLGIRSNLDYCAVFLLGRTLTSQLYVGGVLELFSPSTKAQLDLSERVGEQLRGKSSSEFESAIYQFLKRDPKWIKASRGILAGLNYDSLVMTDSVNVAYRKAYDASRHRQPQNAAKILLDEVNRIDSDILKSIVKQEMASYINEYDKVEAQKTQISAIKSNFRLLKPVEGISYKAMNVTNNNQALVISKHFSNKYQDGNNLVIDVEGVLSNLIFAENTANKFEQAINDLAPVIGFIGQRPENDYRRGPDNLWSMPNANFLVIECKNGCTTNHINKRDCNQLNGSKNWFIEEYGTDTNYTPIMIHQSSCFEYAASPSTDIRIIDLELLTKLINNVRSFISSISSNNKFKNTDEVQTYLKSCNLQSTGIIENYTRSYTRKK